MARRNDGIILTANQASLLRALRDGDPIIQEVDSDTCIVRGLEFSFSQNLEGITSGTPGVWNGLVWRRQRSDGAYIFGLTPEGEARARGL